MDLAELERVMSEGAANLPQPEHRIKDHLKGLAGFNFVFPLTRWNPPSVSDGVKVSFLDVKGMDILPVRGDAVIQGDWSMSEILSIINNMEPRKKWDDRFEGATQLELLNFNDMLVHSVQKGAFMVSGRDFLTVNSIPEITEESLLAMAASVNDSKGPAANTNGKVRGEIMFAGWKVARKDDGLHVTYIVKFDPKGSIPSSLVKMVQSQTPMCIKTVEKCLQQHGPTPHVLLYQSVKPTEGISLTDREVDFNKLVLAYTIKPDVEGKLHIALPAAKFADGANVTMEVEGGNMGTVQVIDRATLGGLTSTHTKWIIALNHSSSSTTQHVKVNIKPGKGGKIQLNGSDL